MSVWMEREITFWFIWVNCVLAERDSWLLQVLLRWKSKARKSFIFPFSYRIRNTTESVDKMLRFPRRFTSRIVADNLTESTERELSHYKCGLLSLIATLTYTLNMLIVGRRSSWGGKFYCEPWWGDKNEKLTSSRQLRKDFCGHSNIQKSRQSLSHATFHHCNRRWCPYRSKNSHLRHFFSSKHFFLYHFFHPFSSCSVGCSSFSSLLSAERVEYVTSWYCVYIQHYWMPSSSPPQNSQV